MSDKRSISSRASTKSSRPPAAWRRSPGTSSLSPPVPATVSQVWAEPERAKQHLTAEGAITSAASLKELNLELESKRQTAESVRKAQLDVNHTSTSVSNDPETSPEVDGEGSVLTIRPEPLLLVTPSENPSSAEASAAPAALSVPTPQAESTQLKTSPVDDVPDTPLLPPASRSWFDTIGLSSLVFSNPQSASQSHSTTVASSITSVDDSVPSPPQSIISHLMHDHTEQPPVLVPSGSNGAANGDLPTLNSLNPSTSRFTLAIPLLGRPKVPLEKALQDQAAQKDVANMNQEELNSWWSYVGWTNPATSPKEASQSDSVSTPEINAEGALPQIVEPTTPLPVPVTSPEVSSSSSVISAAPSSSWLAPWAWSGSASATTLATTPGAKTEAEEIKEAALNSYERERRDSAPPAINVQAASPPATPDRKRPLSAASSGKDINPLESSISQNSTSWASFFSLGKGLGRKAMDDANEDVMEVMDVPDDISVTSAPVRGRPSSMSLNTPSTSSLRSPKGKAPGTQTQTHTPETSPSPKNRKPAPASEQPATPLTNSDTIKRDNAVANIKNSVSGVVPGTASTSKTTPNKKGSVPPPKAPRPNLMLPTWGDTFLSAPRSIVPARETARSALTRGLSYVGNVLFQQEAITKKQSRRKREREKEMMGSFGLELPRAYEVMKRKVEPSSPLEFQLEDVLHGVKRVVVIGVHGWFPGGIVKTLTGEPTGTSGKFADMMIEALEKFQEKHGVRLEKITRIPLEGEGTINKRLEKLYTGLMSNKEWLAELHVADAIIVSAHSQGSIVSVHLLDRLLRQGHIRTTRAPSSDIGQALSASGGTGAAMGPGFGARNPQKIVCLAMCGIHLGPLRYLSSSSLLQQYFQYFETEAARELFEFQDTESVVSQAYVKSLGNVLHHGSKMVYVASLNDQVVGLYSGLFTAASHPLILRGLYIDGDAYQSTDFLSNLLVLLLRVLNSGISDSGLLAHLSEATAGTLNGVGHSTIYDEPAVFRLAVDYLFLVNDGEAQSDLVVDSFNANSEQNDYEIPWALRDVIADERVAYFFSKEILQLRDEFRDWHPKTAILREIKRKLQPIQRLPRSLLSSDSKL